MKNKKIALIIAFIFGIWTFIYTFSIDKKKLGLHYLTIFFLLASPSLNHLILVFSLFSWIFSIGITLSRNQSFYENYNKNSINSSIDIKDEEPDFKSKIFQYIFNFYKSYIKKNDLLKIGKNQMTNFKPRPINLLKNKKYIILILIFMIIILIQYNASNKKAQNYRAQQRYYQNQLNKERLKNNNQKQLNALNNELQKLNRKIENQNKSNSRSSYNYDPIVPQYENPFSSSKRAERDQQKANRQIDEMYRKQKWGY